MKAARNARFRLIPGNVRAQVMATARQSGQTRVVEAQPVYHPQYRPGISSARSVAAVAGAHPRGSNSEPS